MDAERPDPRQVLGRAGEALAEAVLRGAGLRILARRFRTRTGEIDLVAEDGDLLVFVEVKTRRLQGYGAPAEAVTALKERRIAATALVFLQRHGWLDRRCRFDVVELVGTPGAGAAARHLVDAFRPRSPGRRPR